MRATMYIKRFLRMTSQLGVTTVVVWWWTEHSLGGATNAWCLWSWSSERIYDSLTCSWLPTAVVRRRHVRVEAGDDVSWPVRTDAATGDADADEWPAASVRQRRSGEHSLHVWCKSSCIQCSSSVSNIRCHTYTERRETTAKVIRQKATSSRLIMISDTASTSSIIFARWQHASWSWYLGCIWDSNFGSRGGRKLSAMVPFERAIVVSFFLLALHCDHCVISNHSVAICRRMSPTHKLTGVSHFGQNLGRKGLADVSQI